ncbi:unnamed protein product [Caenorhabditis bovis]|uniref:Uncharacterized protein n=1 Tax=Caenorhabditis bovis TaxID=2654633 RepID=A0A8S1ELB9_9PELO|nr:unnamed protein product [Caenorhabditis bovis]
MLFSLASPPMSKQCQAAAVSVPVSSSSSSSPLSSSDTAVAQHHRNLSIAAEDAISNRSTWDRSPTVAATGAECLNERLKFLRSAPHKQASPPPVIIAVRDSVGCKEGGSAAIRGCLRVAATAGGVHADLGLIRGRHSDPVPISCSHVVVSLWRVKW